MATGEKRAIIIEGNPGVLTEEEIKERLAVLDGLKIHPREKSENLLLLTQAERLYEDLMGEKREFFSVALRDYIAALNSPNASGLPEAKLFLENLLDQWRIKYDLD